MQRNKKSMAVVASKQIELCQQLWHVDIGVGKHRASHRVETGGEQY